VNSQISNEKGPPVADEYGYTVVDALDAVAKETGRTVSQVALNWLLRRPTVSSAIIGVCDEQQHRDNLGPVGGEARRGRHDDAGVPAPAGICRAEPAAGRLIRRSFA
jgi:diketogulonate reductase-like aldo/keto reductase